MPNTSGNAYALTTLCPINDNTGTTESGVLYTRTVLQDLPTGTTDGQEKLVSPMAKVPNTYLARFFILDDVIFQNFPYQMDHLKSSYLVFTSNFYGDLDTYLRGMYKSMKSEIFSIWKYCYGFEDVVKRHKTSEADGETSFVQYIRKCQMKTTFYFNGSTDDSLAEQLKSLYLKQEFSKFVFEHQGVEGSRLKEAFKKFIQEKKPIEISPTWKAGVSHLDEIISA